MAEQTFVRIFFFLKGSIYPKSDAKDTPKLLKFEKSQTLTLNISRTAGNISILQKQVNPE
jgi:hypothetical protein